MELETSDMHFDHLLLLYKSNTIEIMANEWFVLIIYPISDSSSVVNFEVMVCVIQVR
jgi:hypothetical protein